jgi:ABC-type amino acid transport substrate-binding protein
MRKILVVLFLTGLLVVAFLMPSVAQAKGAHPTIVVGTSPDYPPFESVAKGKIVGFDMDLVKEIGKRLGYKVAFVGAEFTTLIPDLATPPSPYDMVASALTINDAREDVIDFSAPYFISLYDSQNPIKDQFYGFGFPSGSALRAQVNEALAGIKADGTYTKIFKAWFGFAPEIIP